MFIELSQFMGYFKDREPTQPVWVNPAYVTYINTYTREQPRYDLDYIEGLAQKTLMTTTSLSFPAGLREESDSITVMETPAEIMRIIRMEQSK